MSTNPAIGLAFLAGLLSFLSPCVFPLVPVYAGYLGGRATEISAISLTRARATALLNGVAFVAGFSLVFVLFYYVFHALDITVFTAHRQLFNIIAGGIIVVFALQLLGVLRFNALLREFRVHASPQAGAAGSLVLGVSFAAGWSPCLGPQLGAILTLAQNHDFGGLPFMLVYCLGLAVPFLAVSVLAGEITPLLRRANRHMHIISTVSGGVLLLFGILIATGKITVLSTLSPGSPFNL